MPPPAILQQDSAPMVTPKRRGPKRKRGPKPKPPGEKMEHGFHLMLGDRDRQMIVELQAFYMVDGLANTIRMAIRREHELMAKRTTTITTTSSKQQQYKASKQRLALRLYGFFYG